MSAKKANGPVDDQQDEEDGMTIDQLFGARQVGLTYKYGDCYGI